MFFFKLKRSVMLGGEGMGRGNKTHLQVGENLFILFNLNCLI